MYKTLVHRVPYAAPVSHRDDLLAAAKRLIVERGYTRTTARDLVAASGTNLGSIGYHFGSKERLMRQALHELLHAWAEELDRAALSPRDANPRERLAASWSLMLGGLADRRALSRAMFESIAEGTRDEELRAVIAAQHARTREEVTRTVRAALGPEGEAAADTLARFLLAVADGFMMQDLIEPGQTPTGEELGAALGAAVAIAQAGGSPQEA